MSTGGEVHNMHTSCCKCRHCQTLALIVMEKVSSFFNCSGFKEAGNNVERLWGWSCCKEAQLSALVPAVLLELLELLQQFLKALVLNNLPLLVFSHLLTPNSHGHFTSALAGKTEGENVNCLASRNPPGKFGWVFWMFCACVKAEWLTNLGSFCPPYEP